MSGVREVFGIDGKVCFCGGLCRKVVVEESVEAGILGVLGCCLRDPL